MGTSRTVRPESPPPADLKAAFEHLEQELLSLQRLALLGSSAVMLAHELNNLMTPLLARSQDAAEHGDEEAMRSALRKTVTLVQRAIDLTRHFVSVSGAARSTPAPIDKPTRPAASASPAPEASPAIVAASADEAVREAVQTFARPFEKDGVTLDLRIEPALRVAASPVLLHQLLFNLLSNARHALDGRKGTIAVSARRDGDAIVIDLRDTGRGMPAELIDTVINPFLAADETVRPADFPPVGLGLAVCRRIARDHRATLRAVPQPPPGCTFQLRWPAA